MTGKVLSNITEINAWGGYKLIPQIDEKAEDIWNILSALRASALCFCL